MSFTLTTSGAAKLKAGVNANSTIIASGSALNSFSDMVEASICAQTGYDWVTNYSSLSTNFKEAVGELASGMIASKIIVYDTSNYSSVYEAELLLDVLRDDSTRLLKELSSPENRKKMGASS